MEFWNLGFSFVSRLGRVKYSLLGPSSVKRVRVASLVESPCSDSVDAILVGASGETLRNAIGTAIKIP